MHRTVFSPTPAADPSWTRTRPKPGSQEQAARIAPHAPQGHDAGPVTR
ncbi:hypothetical protein ACGFT2_08555 [Streptomyces sp. NPDC048514]